MKKIYMLGIGGTGMGNLAQMFKAKGYEVSGSDLDIYPPMSTQLEKSLIHTYKPYNATNISEQKSVPDLVIIGNVIRRDNVEAQYVLNNNLNYMSLPEALNKFFITGKKSVVIAGTHGKTTTSFMAAWMLENLGQKPGFFIGGVPKDFSVMGREAIGDFFVSEGDEYDTAFFDKEAKFFHYDAKYLILTSIEFDHADIYKDIDHIKNTFAKLLKMLPPDGCVVYNGDEKNILDIIDNAKCKKISYGINNPDLDCLISNIRIEKNSETPLADPVMKFDLCFKDGFTDGNIKTFEMHIPGKQNVLNAAAAILLARQLGFDLSEAKHAFRSFRGVKRRQEVIGTPGGRILIDDFAHHPTAIDYTIDAIHEWYSPRRVWSVYEPRTATARTNTLADDLINALAKAQHIILAPVHQPERVTEDKRLDPKGIAETVRQKGVDATALPSVDAIVQFLCDKTAPGDVILIMSNGGFGNIYAKLTEALSK